MESTGPDLQLVYQGTIESTFEVLHPFMILVGLTFFHGIIDGRMGNILGTFYVSGWYKLTKDKFLNTSVT